HAQDLLTTSGALIVEGATTLNGSLTVGSTFTIGGITYTFPTNDGSSSGKVLKTDANGQLSWSDDNTGGASFTAGQGLSLNGTVFTLNSTLTGSLLDFDTFSGTTVHAQDLLTTSGALIVEGNATIHGTLSGATFYGAGLYDCDDPTNSKLLWNVTTGQFSCGIDQSGGGNPNVDYYVRTGGDTMTGGLLIMNGGNGTQTVQAGVLLEVGGVMSGASIHAQDILTSSGQLIIKSSAKVGLGAAVIVAAERQTGAYIFASGAAVLALDSPQGSSRSGTGTSPHIAFGYNGYFDVKLFRSGYRGSGELVLRTEANSSILNQNAFRIVTSDPAQSGFDQNIFRFTTSGNAYADGTFSGGGADYAEWFYSRDILAHGELVCIDVTRNNSVHRCENDADGNLMGVVSSPDQAAFIGNRFWGIDGITPPHHYLIGLIGQVAAYVTDENGPIRPGDSLTSSNRSGYARRANAGEPTVGVALEGHAVGDGRINVLIARKNSSVTVETVEQKVLETVAAMEIEDEVSILISDAVKNLSFEDDISEEIGRQVNSLDINTAIQKALSNATGAHLPFASGTWFDPVEFKEDTTISGGLHAGAAEFAGNVAFRHSAEVSGSLKVLKDIQTSYLAAGSLSTQSGARIGGSLEVGGVLKAASMHSDDADISGDLSVGGRLLLHGKEVDLSQYVVGGSGSVVDFGELTVRDALFVLGDITIGGLARFLGDVDVMGNLSVSGSLVVNRNQAGYAVIPETGTAVTVRFTTPFTGYPPIVSASADEPVLFGVSKATLSGFTIKLAQPALRDITFSWVALVPDRPLTFTGATKAQSLSKGDFPVDELGYPLSSSSIWNQCIRNQAPLDLTGQPFNCRRYHDEDLWTHPDLLIEFLWDPNALTKLVLPDGYTMVLVKAEDMVEEQEDADAPKPPEEDVASGTILSTGEQEQGGSGTVLHELEPEAGSGETVIAPETGSGSSDVSSIDTGSGNSLPVEEKVASGSTVDESEVIPEEPSEPIETVSTGSDVIQEEGTGSTQEAVTPIQESSPLPEESSAQQEAAPQNTEMPKA
ncbi:hypothetical protein COU76_03555, partial [Candidatus Peregrinibacteria bacterium CG10_big_fil_rev_8_21_14_0_10_49_10]